LISSLWVTSSHSNTKASNNPKSHHHQPSRNQAAINIITIEATLPGVNYQPLPSEILKQRLGRGVKRVASQHKLTSAMRN